jgi:hypothetical protein
MDQYPYMPPPTPPAPKQVPWTAIAVIAVAVSIALVAFAMIRTAKSSPVAAPTVAPSPSPTTAPSPSPVAIDPVVVESPLDEAMAFVHQRVYVISFCNVINSWSGGLSPAIRIWATFTATENDPNTIGRAWNDAVKKYGIPMRQLATAFYHKYC